MPRPVYSTLFVGEALSAGGPPVGFIPTSDQVAVIRDIVLLDFDGLPGDELLLRLRPAAIAIKIWQPPTTGTYQVDWSGRIVVPYGFSFDFQSVDGTWNVFCSGYVLTNP